jgi:hypothetical protein
VDNPIITADSTRLGTGWKVKRHMVPQYGRVVGHRSLQVYSNQDATTDATGRPPSALSAALRSLGGMGLARYG